MHKLPGLADIEVSREENYPEVNVVVDREKAALLGISETDVANAVLFSLNGNGQTDPIIYTDPQNGNEYLHQRLAGGRTPKESHRHREHSAHHQEPANRSCSRTSPRSS